MHVRHLILLAFCVSLGAAPTMAQSLAPDSREYKLMLDPAHFPPGAHAAAVETLWEERLKPLIARALDPRDGGGTRAKGKPKEDKQRRIVFRDTAGCVLSTHGYSLRERTKLKGGVLAPKSRETTLKLRTPDNIIAASAPRKGAKLEEDIAPLLVRSVDAADKETGARFAVPPSMRSMFSVSLDEEPESANPLRVVADAISVYSDLQKRVHAMGGPDIDPSSELKQGPAFHEIAFEGAEVDLGKDVDAEIDISLWYEDGTLGQKPPRIAELSFKYDVGNPRAVVQASHRALRLFKALQIELAALADPEAESKTAIALPDDCKKPSAGK